MKSIRLILMFFILLTGFCIADETPTVKSLAVTNPAYALFVGNSYFYYNNSLHIHLQEMIISSAVAERETLGFKSVTINGARLKHHEVSNYVKPGQLGIDAPFQVVILQGHSTAALTQDNSALFERSVKRHSEAARRQGAEVALYMTPAYVYPHKLQRDDLMRDIESLYTKVGNEIGALVIPVGLAFEEAYRRNPHLKLHNSNDGSHPSLLGTYLGAATVFTALYNRSPIGNGYDYFGAIDADTRLFLQQVAHDTVSNFYQ